MNDGTKKKKGFKYPFGALFLLFEHNCIKLACPERLPWENQVSGTWRSSELCFSDSHGIYI